jgi:hypothetical protein
MESANRKTQANSLAMFPLGVFLLPGEDIPLRIFEPRYKQLISECEANGMTFGIPYVSDGRIMPYGTEVELLSIVARNSLNEMVVLIRGIRNFHLLHFDELLPGKLYGGGTIEPVDDTFRSTNPELAVLIKKLKLDLDPNVGTMLKSDSINLTDVAKALMLQSDEKYRFYALREQRRMEFFLIKHLRFIEAIRLQEAKLQNNFMLN